MVQETNPKDILVITADEVKETGTISFMFMIEADPERKLSPMPQKFGVILHDQKDNSHFFNVFEGGRGLIAGGGWTSHDGLEGEKEILDALPSCTLLMDIDSLPWWNELTGRHEVQFRHHHFPGILKTS